jgi:hypothetical protein
MKERTIEERKLVLDTLIAERSLIIYVIQSDISDNKSLYPKEYTRALRDEIKNHKTALQEYKKGLNKLKNN